ncbi:MAG: tol-pal system-associated acyl-CoA thioesterase [Rhodocyclaceae bacterium]|jgi:acyl-CoA thioester hydrolase|nr:tol-pal system-associated acyl-CoA thioesterase [Rhodocyclaceae bacterium]
MQAASPSRFLLPVRVYYEDTDAGGVVYYANYLRFLERARTEWLRSLGFVQSVLMEQRIAFAVRSMTTEYLKPARLDDELLVVSTIESLGRAQIVFRQGIERAGEALVEAKIRVACFDPVRGRATAMPKEIHATFGTLL